MWNRIKNIEGKNKYDIDSIIDEQIKFYSKLFTTEGWDENSANKLTQHIESKLNGDEKETLELDVSIEEIKNVLKIFFFQVQRNIELIFPLLPPILFLNEFLRLPLFVYTIS
jgi:hypothetical protein